MCSTPIENLKTLKSFPRSAEKVVFLLLLLVPALLCPADDLQRLLRQALREIESNTQTLVVSFGSFTYGDKGIASSFSTYLETQLGLVVAESDRFELFAKDRLHEILEAMEIGLNDLTDPETTVMVGKLKGIQGLFSGRFFESGESIQIALQLLSVETGIVLGQADIRLPLSMVPQTVSVKPENYNDALYVLNELTEVENASNQDFVVKVWTSGGEVYRDGEALSINFYANRECYIKVYHIDVNRNLQLIFPNPYYTDNFIKAKKMYKIPDDRYPFEFILGAPYGAEFIKVMASTVQFADVEESFADLGTSSRELIERGLKVIRKKEQVTEAMISYTILE